MGFVFLLLMFALMWAFIIRPQQRKVKEHRAFVASLEVGEEVVTSSGVYGTITDLSAERARLLIAPGVEITIARLALAHRPVAETPVHDPDADTVSDDDDLGDSDRSADPASSADDSE